MPGISIWRRLSIKASTRCTTCRFRRTCRRTSNTSSTTRATWCTPRTHRSSCCTTTSRGSFAAPAISATNRRAALELEHLHIPYVRQRAQLLLDGLGHDLIHAHDRNGVLLRRLAPQVECRDIDVGFPQHGAQGSDETRPVQIVDEQHHRMEIRFQSHAFHLDDLRASRVDDAGKRPPTPP